jgi:hypothetical protein
VIGQRGEAMQEGVVVRTVDGIVAKGGGAQPVKIQEGTYQATHRNNDETKAVFSAYFFLR